MTLDQLLAPLHIEAPNIALTGIELDSRKVKPGHVFVALVGHQLDGRQFIPQAKQNGAVAVLTQTLVPELDGVVEADAVPQIHIHSLNEKLAALADDFYHTPSQKLHMIGVTGTNGKTSVCQFIRALSESDTAQLGTLGWFYRQQSQALINTTPDALLLQSLLAKSLTSGATQVAMEVSSHALEQHRVAQIAFDTAIFTNLSRDHLDYHPDMASYLAAKEKLFFMPGVSTAIVNTDDEAGYALAQKLQGRVKVIGYGRDVRCSEFDAHCQWRAQALPQGLQLGLSGALEAQLEVPLYGEFNGANLVAALLALYNANPDAAEQYLSAAQSLTPVPGRMEAFASSHGQLVVDYAHTPDALEKALQSLRLHCKGQLYCVFGCGGDRDKGKRPLMGEIAQTHADHILITNDNPRTEDPAQIAEDILTGLASKEQAQVVLERKEAIRRALETSQPGDIVLIAGKGHETYQEIQQQRIPYDERNYIMQLIQGETA